MEIPTCQQTWLKTRMVITSVKIVITSNTITVNHDILNVNLITYTPMNLEMHTVRIAIMSTTLGVTIVIVK